MSDNKNKDGSYKGNSRSGISAIGIIGGSFRPKRDAVLEEKYRNWVEECAKSMKACSHSIEETEQFFLKQCEAIPIGKDDHRMKGYQYSVVMNYFRDMLNHKPSAFSIDSNDEDQEKWVKEQSDIHREIRNTPPEHYGIKISGYYLPQTERNSYLYEEAEEMMKILQRKHDINVKEFLQDICFYFEETTGDIQCSNGGRSLINQIFVFRGVGEEDINSRNPRFLGYINSMRELGYLPDFRK